MADRGRCARRGALRSTFQRLVWTSTMRPTTRSPISGVYRARSGRIERSLLVLRRVPATDEVMVEVVGGRYVPWPLFVSY